MVPEPDRFALHLETFWTSSSSGLRRFTRKTRRPAAGRQQRSLTIIPNAPDRSGDLEAVGLGQRLPRWDPVLKTQLHGHRRLVLRALPLSGRRAVLVQRLVIAPSSGDGERACPHGGYQHAETERRRKLSPLRGWEAVCRRRPRDAAPATASSNSACSSSRLWDAGAASACAKRVGISGGHGDRRLLRRKPVLQDGPQTVEGRILAFEKAYSLGQLFVDRR